MQSSGSEGKDPVENIKDGTGVYGGQKMGFQKENHGGYSFVQRAALDQEAGRHSDIITMGA